MATADRGAEYSVASSKIKTCCEKFMGCSNHVDTRHHGVVFVFEVVAMQQVPASMSAPSDDDLHFLAVFDGNGILPSRLLSQRRTPVPAQKLEGSQMGMNRMQHR